MTETEINSVILEAYISGFMYGLGEDEDWSDYLHEYSFYLIEDISFIRQIPKDQVIKALANSVDLGERSMTVEEFMETYSTRIEELKLEEE